MAQATAHVQSRFGPRLYVGRLLRRRTDGQWLLFAFRNADEDGRFVGGVTEPMPVGWQGDRLVVQESVRPR